MKQGLGFGLVRCVTLPIPVPDEQKGVFLEHAKGLSVPTMSQVAEPSDLT